MKFRFSPNFVVDSDVEPWRREGLRMAMLGGPGSGKSWNNALVAEQFLAQGGTVVIFQPRDEYYTLKEKFEILSVGGVHSKDMEFVLTSPKTYAKAVIEDGISMIFYTSGLDEEKLVGWVARFINHVLTLQETHKRPLLIILEEAHEYTPKSAQGRVAPPWIYNRMVKAFKDCSTQGRKLNIIQVVSSQRPQELNFTIRQLANLTFYGKFSDQDIGYVDKECLKYIRKRGIEVDASQLVELDIGEWLVIKGKQTGFEKVTQPRLTKHGAETPALEYMVPRTSKAKKSIDQLSKAVTEALKKEQLDKSELEKAKRKIRELTKKLEEAQEKARIKLSVKEMLKTGAEPAELAEKLTKAETENKNLRETHGKAVTLITELKEKLAAFEHFEEALFGLLQPRLIKILKIMKKAAGPPGLEPGAPSEIGLQRTTTIVAVPPAEKHVTITDESTQGKILTVAKKGKLANWTRLSDVTSAIREEALGGTVTPQQVNNALNDLVKQQIIAKKHTDRNYFKLAKNVKFKED